MYNMLDITNVLIIKSKFRNTPFNTNDLTRATYLTYVTYLLQYDEPLFEHDFVIDNCWGNSPSNPDGVPNGIYSEAIALAAESYASDQPITEPFTITIYDTDTRRDYAKANGWESLTKLNRETTPDGENLVDYLESIVKQLQAFYQNLSLAGQTPASIDDDNIKQYFNNQDKVTLDKLGLLEVINRKQPFTDTTYCQMPYFNFDFSDPDEFNHLVSHILYLANQHQGSLTDQWLNLVLYFAMHKAALLLDPTVEYLNAPTFLTITVKGATRYSLPKEMAEHEQQLSLPQVTKQTFTGNYYQQFVDLNHTINACLDILQQPHGLTRLFEILCYQKQRYCIFGSESRLYIYELRYTPCGLAPHLQAIYNSIMINTDQANAELLLNQLTHQQQKQLLHKLIDKLILD